MKEQDKKMVLPKLDDLFTSQEQRDNPVVDEVKEIELYKIGEFPDHPFRVIDDDKMEEMVKSVKEHGVLLPVIVRKRGEGNYQMISGHRRKRACELAGIDKIKCIVKELTDDEATILMVDSNIQREEILPSEKAFAYKMKLEAMKHQGKRVDLEENETSRPLDGKLESAERMGEEVGESARTIQRYIRLTYLIPELLEQVDNKRIAFRPAVELSYLSEENQYVVVNIFEFDEVTPSLSQAIRLKKLEQEGNLTEEKIEELKAYLLNPASMTLKEFLLRLGVGATKWGHGLECTLFAVEYCHNNNIKPGEKLYTALEENGFSERELRSAKEIACKVKTPLYKRVFEMYELSLRPPSNTQFITTIEIYYYSSEASSEKTESH